MKRASPRLSLGLLALVLLQGCDAREPVREPPVQVRRSIAPMLRAAVAEADGELASFYADRDYQPLWVEPRGLKPEADRLLAMIASAGADGLDPEAYGHAPLRALVAQARRGDEHALVAAELRLSRALADYLVDLRRPADPDAMFFVDESLAPKAPTHREVLDGAGASLHEQLQVPARMNPLYRGMRRSLAAYRQRWSGLPRVVIPEGPALAPGAVGDRVPLLRRRLGLPEGNLFDAGLARAVAGFKVVHGLPRNPLADAETIRALNAGPEAYERIIRTNLERARLLPEGNGRYVIVDTAAARLWMIENGRIADTMKVIVGKRGQETPVISGLIRFAALNPYWNVPPDIARDRIARRVLREGTGFIARERLELLTDWSGRARVIRPAQVNWSAVAAGRQYLRARQLPGAGNMMGTVKFMFPNRLGIYLHDTPNKAAFQTPDRRLSSGCVRVEDAPRLSRWLFGGREISAASSSPEQRVDLPEPVPVFITYLTASPGPREIVFQRDIYGRDAAALARLERVRASSG